MAAMTMTENMEEKRRFTILLGGDITPTARLKKQVEGTRVIAADSGIAHASALGLAPELWVGDFDSAGTELEAAFAHVPRHVFPAAKDATDGEIAITEALKRGATDILLVGAFGGQFDHTLAHAIFLMELAKRGISASMSSGTEEAHALLQLLFFVDIAPGTRLSIIPLTPLKGLTISGLRWPLKERNVPRGATLTLSNECIGGRVAMGVESGEALVVLYPA
jgi:thiamine pyrophosphokinase